MVVCRIGKSFRLELEDRKFSLWEFWGLASFVDDPALRFVSLFAKINFIIVFS